LNSHNGTYDWERLIQDQRVHRDVYTDPGIFDLEMSKLYGGLWTYLCHESELPEANSFRRTRLGLRNVIVTRDRDGDFHGLFNRCAHRAATVCTEAQGRKARFVCPYHGWTYGIDGELIGVPFPAGYGKDFDKSTRHLPRIPRVESFNGFIFGTLNAAMPSLTDYLGGAGDVLKEFVDHAPNGKLELRSGAYRSSYTGNWKLAWDNAADMYHVFFAHRSLVDITRSRYPGNDTGAGYAAKPDDMGIYSYYFGNGHTYLHHRPAMGPSIFERARPAPGTEIWAEALREKVGKNEADDLLESVPGQGMNLNIFPNLMIIASQIQVVQPVSVDRTELTWYATTLADAPDEANVIRMRIAEDFPNFGEVDDLEMFQRCWEGLQIPEAEWLDCSRGAHIPAEELTDENGVIKASGTMEHTIRGYFGDYKNFMREDMKLAAG
jgi:phenylpropionate dioxygenase-like ring-hydroxylating dioxygenase large terminal subunit